MATKKISELSTYTESSISDATQALVPLDDLTVVGTGKTKHMSFAEQAKWFGSHLPKLAVNPGVALTASAPFTLSQNWNNNAVTFEGVKVVIDDDASAAGSRPLQVSGGAAGTTSLFYVNKSGDSALAGVLNVAGYIQSTGTDGFYVANNSAGVYLGASSDVALRREAANHLALRNGANAQNLSVYNTYTSGSVYQRGRFGWDTGVLEIGTEHVGVTAGALALQTDGTTRVTIDANGAATTFTGQIRTNDTAFIGFTGQAGLASPSAGVLRLRDWADTDFNRLQLGGTTSSYPSIARSGANIQIKLADDSALTGLEAKTLTATGGTLTASAPSLNVTQTWNNAAVAFEGSKTVITDTASAAGSLPWQVLGGAAGTTNLASVNKSGLLSLGTNSAIGFNGRSGAALAAYFSGIDSFDIQPGGVTLRSTGAVLWSATDDASAATDVRLYRIAANHLALRNDTNAQAFSVYGSYTSPSVYNRLRTYYNGSTNYYIAAEYVGDSPKGVVISVGGIDSATFGADGIVRAGSSFRAAANDSFFWNARSSMQSPSDGVISLTNNAITDFGRLQLGGTTSSFPSIARSGANIQIKLADNSALTGLEAATLTLDNVSAALTVKYPGENNIQLNYGGLFLYSLGVIGWSSSNTSHVATRDAFIERIGPNHIGIKNSTNSQSFSVYGSYTSGSVYNRLRTTSNASYYRLVSEHVGDSQKGIQIDVGAIQAISVESNGLVYFPNNALLPAAGYLQWNGVGSIRQTSDGVFRLLDSGGTTARLQLGGTGTGTPSIGHSGANLTFKLGNDSAFTTIEFLNGVQTGYSQLTEMTAPAAPSANQVRIYAEDNGAGKTRLMAIFPSGAAQQIAIEP